MHISNLKNMLSLKHTSPALTVMICGIKLVPTESPSEVTTIVIKKTNLMFKLSNNVYKKQSWSTS